MVAFEIFKLYRGVVGFSNSSSRYTINSRVYFFESFDMWDIENFLGRLAKLLDLRFDYFSLTGVNTLGVIIFFVSDRVENLLLSHRCRP